MPVWVRGRISIAQLEQMLNECKSERQKLERKRNKVARRLQQLDSRIARWAATAVGAAARRSRRLGGGGGGIRVRNAKSLIEMLEGVLGKSGKPMKVGDIADAVQKRRLPHEQRQLPRHREPDADQGQAIHVRRARGVSDEEVTDLRFAICNCN